jgi:hypothetical protein
MVPTHAVEDAHALPLPVRPLPAEARPWPTPYVATATSVLVGIQYIMGLRVEDEAVKG